MTHRGASPEPLVPKEIAALRSAAEYAKSWRGDSVPKSRSAGTRVVHRTCEAFHLPDPGVRRTPVARCATRRYVCR